jgi:hypothetical protein
MVLTGQMSSQTMQAIAQGVFTAMVSNEDMNPASCGHTATHAPQLMHAFQPIWKITGALVFAICFKLFCKRKED